MSFAFALVTKFKDYFVTLWAKEIHAEQSGELSSISFQYDFVELKDGWLTVDGYRTDQYSDVIKKAFLDIFETGDADNTALLKKCLEVSKMEHSFDDVERALVLFVMRNRLMVNSNERTSKKEYNFHLKPIETAIGKIE